MSPVATRRGRNAAMLVIMVATTGRATSLVPTTAARSGSIPPDTYLCTFSTTIMESSTITPSTIMRPNMERMLSVLPVTPISIRAPRKETGIPRAAMKAALRSRKRARRSSTMKSPSIPFLTMVLRRLLTQTDLSLTTVISICSGISVSYSATSRFTAAVVSSMSASFCFLTKKVIAGRPFILDLVFSFWSPRTTSATSRSRTCPPSGLPDTGTARSSSTELIFPPVFNRNSMLPREKFAPGISRFFALTASETRSIPNPYCIILRRSRCTQKAGSASPNEDILSMPLRKARSSRKFLA